MPETPQRLIEPIRSPQAVRAQARVDGRPRRLGTVPRMLLALATAGAVAGQAADRTVASTDDDEMETHASHMVPLFVSDDGVRQGFVRVINHSEEAGDVRIEAVDDAGDSFDPLTLAVGAGQTVHFNSTHLENGDPEKGWDVGTGPGEGDWRLTLSSELDIEVLSYIRMIAGGFVTSMHDTAPAVDDDHGDDSDDGHSHGDDDHHGDDAGHAYRIAIFNPGSNTSQVSRLRVINSGHHDADVEISGTDDHGHASAGTVHISVPHGAARTFSAAELEAGGDGMEGALGDGAGKWRLTVRSDEPVTVMSLLQSPTDHLTNLSAAPANLDDHDRHTVPFFPAASDPHGRQGFARVINHDSDAGTVEIPRHRRHRRRVRTHHAVARRRPDHALQLGRPGSRRTRQGPERRRRLRHRRLAPTALE